MYKTFSSIILNRFEALNLRLLAQMTNARPPTRAVDIREQKEMRAMSPGVGEDEPMDGTSGNAPGRTGTPVGTPAKAGGAGAAKKKKKGKR